MVTLQELHEILANFDYPATRDDLLAAARAHDVPDEVLIRLHHLPEHYYGSVNTVMDTLRAQA